MTDTKWTWVWPDSNPPLWHLTIAYGGWAIADCSGTCGREFGMTKDDRYIKGGELIVCRPTTDDLARDAEWFCVPCVMEIVNADWLRANDEYEAARPPIV